MVQQFDVSRKNVRDTSIMAYHELIADPQRMSKRYQLILTAIWEIGRPSSAYELVNYLRVGAPNFVRPRINELTDSAIFKPPLLRAGGKRKCTVTGKTVYTWRFTDAGKNIAALLIQKQIKEHKWKDKCKQCGHVWVRRTASKPKKCPRCRQPLVYKYVTWHG